MSFSRHIALAVFLGCSSEPVPEVQLEPPMDAMDAGQEPEPTLDAGRTEDTGPDRRCNPVGALRAPVKVEGLSSAETDAKVWVSPDELRAYVQRGDSPRIYVSARASRTDAFPSPVVEPKLATINALNGFVSGQSLTDDELTIYFAHQPPSGLVRIMVATRASVSDPFGAPASVQFDGNAANYVEPYVTSDGMTLYVGDLPSGRIIRATKGADATRFVSAMRQTNLVVAEAGMQRIVGGLLSRNGNLLFSAEVNPAKADIYLASGAAPTIIQLTALNSADYEFPGSFSGDGCVLYLTRGGDIYSSTRAQ